MQVLVFDSSKEIAERLIGLISEARKGITFYKAFADHEAVNLLKKIQPHAVLLDLNFPGNSAIELLKQIKSMNDKTIVIVLFGMADEFSLNQFKTQGADFIFDKYDDFEKIPDIINTIQTN